MASSFDNWRISKFLSKRGTTRTIAPTRTSKTSICAGDSLRAPNVKRIGPPKDGSSSKITAEYSNTVFFELEPTLIGEQHRYALAHLAARVLKDQTNGRGHAIRRQKRHKSGITQAHQEPWEDQQPT